MIRFLLPFMSAASLGAAALLAGCSAALPAALPAAVSTPAAQRAPMAPVPAVAPPVVAERPTLVVLLTVDQLRPDYFERFGPQLTGGLARLAQQGAFFTAAYQDHAITETAPGHASTLSGRFPRSTGIVRNAAGVQDPQAPLLGGGGPGASPFRFRGGTLIDWMRLDDPRSRALSVSRKDRGAILPLGRAQQQAFWYASDGRFTTSTYYADTLPSWVRRFNARRTPIRMAGQAWTPLLAASEYPEPDSVAIENGGRDFVFPHVLPTDSAAAVQAFAGFPWMDQLTLDAALEGVKQMDLGAGPQPDLLAVSLSTTDAIGHRYGPDSRELHDQILRLDRMLGVFLDSLYTLRDSARVVVALTADHGVTSFPEVNPGGAAAASYHVDADALNAWLRAELRGMGMDSATAEFDDGILMVDRRAFATAGREPVALADRFVARAQDLPGVQRADRVRDLARGDTVGDAVTRRWLHMIPADAPVEVAVTLEPGHVWGHSAYAAHGSPHDDDAHVPLIFYGAAFRAGRYDQTVRVVDIAPTLARLLGVEPAELLDGRVLDAALR